MNELQNQIDKAYAKNSAFTTPEFEKKLATQEAMERRKSKYTQEQIEAHRAKKADRNKSVTNADPKGIGSNWVYKAAGAGVTGALVLNMFGNKGQQSNSQLYGQGY